jgi:hypothetical protein
VTAFNLNGYSVSSLVDPVVIYLPLPVGTTELVSADEGLHTINCSVNGTYNIPSVTRQVSTRWRAAMVAVSPVDPSCAIMTNSDG